MKRILVSIGSACVIAVGVLPVHAADLPLKAPPASVAYSWAGFYIGGNLGGDWSSFRSDPFGFPVVAGQFPTVGFGGTTSAAAIGGGQFGYNWQFNHLVLGLEADVQDTSHSQTVASLAAFNAAPSAAE